MESDWNVAVGELPRSRRFEAAIAVTLLVMYLVGGAALGIAPSAPARRAPSRLASRAASLLHPLTRTHGGASTDAHQPNVARVIETVSHHITADPAHPRSLVVNDHAYRAAFDPLGYTITPRGETSSFRWTLQTIGHEPVAANAWRADANRALRTVGAGMTEQVTARDGHVEWDLVLAHRPAAAGALVIDATVVHADAVRLGIVRVRDATGAVLSRTTTRVVNGHVSIRVPARVLDHAHYPLTVDPSVTPEVFASPTGTTAYEASPAMAFDGTNYLVVWTVQSGTSDDLYGARVTKSGSVVDPNGIPIATGAFNKLTPAVSFDGTNYFVVWADDRTSSGHTDIYGARVSTAGAVLDTGGFPISTASGEQENPALTFDGTNYLVVWDDSRSGTNNVDDDIYGARVSKAGTVLDPIGLAISTAANLQFLPKVAFDGTDSLIVWGDLRSGGIDVNIYGARVTKTGTVLNPAGIPISTAMYGQFRPALAFDGTNYLVTWSDQRLGGFLDIYGSRVSKTGSVLDPNGIPISTAANDQESSAVAFDGTDFLVVWRDDRSGTAEDVASNIYGARVSDGGTVRDPNGIPISTAILLQQLPAVASDGTNALVTWTDLQSLTSNDIVGARISTSGGVVDPDGFAITTAPNDQRTPAVAFDGTNYLVVWADHRSGTSYDIWGARVDKAGRLLNPVGRPIAIATANQSAPAVAFDGTDYVVVWSDLRSGSNLDIYGARVSTAGDVLDPNGIPISTAAGQQTSPAIASNGSNTLVVWVDSRSGTREDIYGARVNTAGTVLDATGIPISTAANEFEPAVAFDGTDYLAVWDDTRGTSDDIYGARVSTAGSVLDPNGIAISTAANQQTDPAVASDGTNTLVAWSDFRSGTNWDVYDTFVAKNGGVLNAPGIPVSTAPNNQTAPAVAFNGSYLVIWLDRRSGTQTDLYGARVSTGGAVQDASGFLVASGIPDGERVAVARAFGSKWAVGYERQGGYGTGIFTRMVVPK